jgi:hypothetical protein
VNTANTASLTGAATYTLYLDAQTTPFATIPAVTTSTSTSFAKSEIAIGQISGVHKVTLKFNNHASSLVSVGFVDAGQTAVKEVRLSDLYKIYATKSSIVIDGLSNSNVSVYTANGLLVETKLSVTGKVEFPVKQGVYLVVIKGQALKIVV